MRCVTDEYILEARKDGAPWFWVPERVADCPHRACRRARKCLRPEILPHRHSLGWPSCRMTTDREWALWSDGLLRILTGPRDTLARDVAAIGERHLKAARRERGKG